MSGADSFWADDHELLSWYRHAICKKASLRKLRLISVACCHTVSNLFHPKKRTLKLLGLLEQFADQEGLQTQIQTLRSHLSGKGSLATEIVVQASAPKVRDGAAYTIWALVDAKNDDELWNSFWDNPADTDDHTYPGRIANIIRDVIGRPAPAEPTCDPSWSTSTITSLAQTMYDTRNFTAMPILGDALEEAGCTNDDILGHCRNGTDHMRGCWVVDLVLGKE